MRIDYNKEDGMRIVIDGTQSGKCLRQYLKVDLRFSIKMMKYLKYRPDGILVNGERRTVRYILQSGDVLELATEDSESSPKLRAVDLPLEILYEVQYLSNLLHSI